MEGKSKKGKKISRKEKRAAKKEEHKVGLTGAVCHQIIVAFDLLIVQSGGAFKQHTIFTFEHHSRQKDVFSRFVLNRLTLLACMIFFKVAKPWRDNIFGILK